MLLYLVPCNAMANGNRVAEDLGLIAVHDLLSSVLPPSMGG